MPPTLKEQFQSRPCHIAIIMDGNGRWANEQGLPRLEGHKNGVKNVEEVVKLANELDLRVLTLFAFSSENWKRPRSEVSGLMELLGDFLTNRESLLHDNKIKLRIIGRKWELPRHIQALLNKTEKATQKYEKTLCIALSYGSRTEVIDAFKSLYEDIQKGACNPKDLDWNCIEKHLYTEGLPDPDLIIRTSGETRLSNFLLLQGAYAEIYYSPKYWPDFDRNEFVKALELYASRERRFGKTGEQVKAGC